MKRISLVLSMCLLLVLTACGGGQNASAENGKNGANATNAAAENTATEDKKAEDAEAADETTAAADRKVFIDAKELADLQKNEKDLVIVEAAWGEGKDGMYGKKHIPGAIHMNTDSIEEGPVWNLRAADELEKAFLEHGITKDTPVVVYGEDTGRDRVAFTLLYGGVEDVKVLDGNIATWEAAGFETETNEVKPEAAKEFGTKIPAHPEYVLSLEEVQEKLKDDNFKLVSIRSEEEWIGKTSGYTYIPKAGEPKGAVWGKSGEGNSGMDYYVNEDNTHKPWDEIVAMWKEQGFGPENDLSFYCGTGWRACLPWLMAYENGVDATLFDGGWNEWQMHDELEVQVGDPKSDDVVYTTVGELSNDKAAAE